MIEAIESDITCIAVRSPAENMWRGRIPVLDLSESPGVWSRIARKVGFGTGTRVHHSILSKVKSAVDSPDVQAVLIHFLPFALEFEDVWVNNDKPLYVHCHGYDVHWDLRSHDSPDEPFHPTDYLDSVRHLAGMATIIANSQTTAGRLVEAGIPRDQIVVKICGVPVPEEFPGRKSTSEAVNILYLGRLVDFKGPELVIKAFELACEKGLKGQLVIAGDGPLRGHCEQQCKESKFSSRISMLGAVDAGAGENLRAQAHIFTAHNRTGPLTRQEEAYGVSVVEAMAAGLPVVSGCNGSLPELVKHEETGLLVEPGDVEAHAEALLRLAGDPGLRLDMGRAGWEIALECFSSGKEKIELRRILGLDQ